MRQGRGGREGITMTWLPRIASIAFIVALPIFLVTSNIRIYAGEAWFYERGFRAHDADQATGLPLAEVDRAGAEIRAYFENDARFLAITVQDDEGPGPLFSEREVLHMADVKDVMRFMFRLHEISLIVVLGLVAGRFLWASEAPLRTLARDTLAGLGVGLVAVALVGALAVAGFDSAWNQFHELVFSNDFWRLDPDTDRLIQMFPEEYWQDSVLLIAAAIAVQGVILAALAGAYLFITRAEVRPPAVQPPAANPG
jgi:integral membrane protein (TIGR01906 family)